MMVKDHTEFMQQLQKFAGNQGSSGTREGAGLSVNTPGAAVNVGRPGAGDQQLDFMAIKSQIGQRCVELIREDWKDKEGRDFDRCYIRQQLGSHVDMKEAFQLLS